MEDEIKVFSLSENLIPQVIKIRDPGDIVVDCSLARNRMNALERVLEAAEECLNPPKELMADTAKVAWYEWRLQYVRAAIRAARESEK